MRRFNRRPQKESRSILFFFLLLILLPVLVFGGQQIIKYFSKAAGYPARIYVGAAKIEDTLSFSWKALSQGGEEKKEYACSGGE